MAGDWIKMRAELFTHPRFLSLCSALIYGEHHGLLLHVCGPDALGVGVMPPRDESVTALALRHVTEAALRDVTMCALLRVWCSVNAHCKVRGADAVMAPMALGDVDDTAGFRDFGEALRSVGWVVEEDCNTLIFPNFLEFNEPSCLRRRPQTGAERQRAWRERRAAKQPPADAPHHGVTNVTNRNDREEKRREEERREEIPASACADACPEPAPQASEPPVLVFPVVGKPGEPKTWALTRAKLAEYADSYPGVDVLLHCKAALQWCRDNPANRKTARGMGRFLSTWLSKEQNRAGTFVGPRIHDQGLGRASRVRAPEGKYDGVGSTIGGAPLFELGGGAEGGPPADAAAQPGGDRP